MARKNIFEQLSNSSLKEDVSSLDYFIHVEKFDYRYGYHTYETTIEDYANDIFHKWKNRGSAISIYDVRQKLGIENFDTFIATTDNIITYLEYAINVLNIFANNNNPNCTEVSTYINAMHIIKLIIEKMSLKLIQTDSNIGSLILVPNDPIAISVSENLSNEELGNRILQYHHHLLKGDIEKKKGIILDMSLLFEKNEKKMKKGSYSQLTDDISFLLNNFNIRHTFDSKPFSSLSKDELESIYDDLYEIMLTWFSALTYSNETSTKISELRKTAKETK